MNLFKNYLQLVQITLMIFQNIESLIKIYLKKAYKIINIKLDNLFVFNYSEKELNNSSLGNLIKKLDIIISNKKLIKKLKNVTPKRNSIAHSSMLISIKQKKNKQFMLKKVAEVNKIKLEALKYLELLLKEYQTISEKYGQLANTKTRKIAINDYIKGLKQMHK